MVEICYFCNKKTNTGRFVLKLKNGASAGTRTQNNGSVDHRDIHFTTDANEFAEVVKYISKPPRMQMKFESV